MQSPKACNYWWRPAPHWQSTLLPVPQKAQLYIYYNSNNKMNLVQHLLNPKNILSPCSLPVWSSSQPNACQAMTTLSAEEINIHSVWVKFSTWKYRNHCQKHTISTKKICSQCLLMKMFSNFNEAKDPKHTFWIWS